MSENILEVKNLKTYFYTEEAVVPAVDGVSFSIAKGETLGIVGESGSGKSVTALSIMRLLPEPPAKIIGGQVLFKGEDLVSKTNDQMRRVRGNSISMIFQEPMTSLNPVYTIGRQISEAIMLHQKVGKKDAMKKAVEMLKLVKIPLPEKRISDYPHQMSGGMRQRVMIAMALSCVPELLIADEPTTALDVTIQAQILALIKELKERLGTSVILITHDLGVVAEVAEKVMVMYCGRAVEYADVATLYESPRHPYTVGLLNSIPKIKGPKQKLKAIPGVVPQPQDITAGCRFQTRCTYVKDRCLTDEPPLFNVGQSLVRCWNYQQ
ncbi:MAG: peptide/nickel transport system ATP-binding protein [Thermoanaerobacteraceae bacterium]|uniref:ATP-binding cassette domain-containing protein n=1 Tax=Biomaibacter acetigenes TaxID=2316383 RepID=A0A3G2R7G8_9FIRM|nr:ABC transporter ATP-binding protein [Biomaibacter acetigenes]AYO31390.1 ATP-binding cassette domain-containing protein [Biomaibacter acetigenes]MDK2879342.1 peptide/nickel transport system ATP-binding protein [Thermoanaerobacteraceae bacterium]MDN5312267.1 peptide/nickel transport system ATP-binding protein [Thermoanaerobacteraceae bacterium]RKL63324.1 ABC transporter ATP-binding protein [Thermoanaerobacteraceae bacterium SP2]